MAIPFTQYLRPSGARRQISIERSREIEAKAQALMDEGAVFEAEVLTNGTISLTCEQPPPGPEDEQITLAVQLVENGPPVLDAVDRLVIEAQRFAEEYKATVASKKEKLDG